MKLKIGFDAKRLFNNFTGLGNYARTLVRNLQKHYPQHEYHLFTNKVKVNDATSEFTKDPYIVHTPRVGTNITWRTFGQSKTANDLNLDIYHGLSHEIPFGLNPNIKTIVTFHDLIYELNPELFPFVDRILYKLKYRNSAKRAHHIIAISEETKEDLRNHYQVKEQDISIVYQSLRNEFLDIPIEDQSSDYFLYVGSIIERKGLHTIIEAVNKLSVDQRKKCMVIGSGSHLSLCKNLILKYDLQEWFEFENQILDNAKLIKYYDHCIALILPSIKEGFGIPIIEALARKKPVITTQSSAMAEAVGPGGILVEPLDIDAICEAMISIQDQKMNEELGSIGYDHVIKSFNPKVTSENLMKLYQYL